LQLDEADDFFRHAVLLAGSNAYTMWCWAPRG